MMRDVAYQQEDFLMPLSRWACAIHVSNCYNPKVSWIEFSRGNLRFR
jgi:hypothetical protein